MVKLITTIELNEQKQYRVIPSHYPPIYFFEELVDPSEMETLWEIENMTNDRIRQEVGDIFLVTSEDRISGPGSSIVMAAFTHIHRSSRFTDGTFGIYYAALAKETAIKETIYHRERFLKYTNEESSELMMRLYEGNILRPLHDIRGEKHRQLHHPDDYSASQNFGKKIRNSNSWGLLYNSVRDKNGYCIAAFRPKTISIPQPIAHLRYLWNGKKITDVAYMQYTHYT